MGTPACAIPVLDTLLAYGHYTAGVYTQPDRAQGRGREIEMGPVKRFAIERSLSVYQPENLATPQVMDEVSRLRPDVVVVAAYGRILPKELLEIPRHGCINIHPSLLPRYRGPSPVASAIIQGETVTGVTLILLEQGTDTGPIIARKEVGISDDDTTDRLTTRLFKMGAQLLAEILPLWETGEIKATPQDHSLATVTNKITKGDGWVAWNLSAQELERKLRGFTPWPGLYTCWNGRTLKVIEAIALDTTAIGEVGRVVALGHAALPVGVITTCGVLGLAKLQLEGRRPTNAKEFLIGHSNFIGSHLPS